MSEVTRFQLQIAGGDPAAPEQLLPLIYDELRQLAAVKLAHEKPGQTLEATALVHEAYVRLVDADQVQHWNSRGRFLSPPPVAAAHLAPERSCFLAYFLWKTLAALCRQARLGGRTASYPVRAE